ncbi:hypothetical protein GUJ93_ZPchr0012g20294 [Zizania palustris]|uniref:Uncharacterized protein n=1 Tax=Zizania palustris TaxID=103762 RepID=A0A8J5WMP1_ZIZPA|nr:hypothetical protein GUJ93_ZPchr0012g20294 [Zizania palustris]
MAQLLVSSATPRIHLATTSGHGVSRFSVASACSAAHGSLVSMRTSTTRQRSLTVRCERGAKGGGGSGGLDVWLSRGAMLGFVGAITVELTTGKGCSRTSG